jgi:predicted nucleotidyltransferase
MSEVSFHRLDREAVLERLRRYAREELAPRAEVREAVLVGSLARGDWSARSDADVVVIADEASERGPFRGVAYAPRTPLGIDVDVFVYLPEETGSWPARLRDEVQRGVQLYRRAD